MNETPSVFRPFGQWVLGQLQAGQQAGGHAVMTDARGPLWVLYVEDGVLHVRVSGTLDEREATCLARAIREASRELGKPKVGPSEVKG